MVASLVLLQTGYALAWLLQGGVTAEADLSSQSQSEKAEMMCRICPGETINRDQPLSLPDPYSYLQTCGQVADVAEMMLQEGSEECSSLQSLQSYCGCAIPDNACRLCGQDDLVVRNKATVVDFDVPLLTEPYITCEIVQEYLHSTSAESGQCSEGQELHQMCGCGPPPNDSDSAKDENDNDITMGSAQEPVGSDPTKCSLCEDGGTLGFPEKDISSYIAATGAANLFDGIGEAVVTCQMTDTLLSLLAADPQPCSEIRYFLSGICGCPVPPMNGPACVFCGGEELDPDTMVYSIQDYTVQGHRFPPARCGDIELFAQYREKTDDVCFYARQIRHLCGCNGGEFNYLNSGANSNDQVRKKALAWSPRATGLLSLLGSILIIRDVLKRRRSNNNTVYHQIIFGISIFDAFGSVGWILSTLPIPEYTTGGDPTAIYGAKGNEGTCTAQGFILQLGYTSIFYNVSLSFYYLLTIRYGWRDAMIRPYFKWFHVPAVFGLGLALAGIPYYSNSFFVCHLVPPPLAKNFRVIIWFVIVPITSGMVLATGNMCLVYLHVRAQDARANRWRFNSHLSSSIARNSSTPPRGLNTLERAVFWQSIFYLVAFYSAWPLTMIAYTKSNIDRGYPFWLTLVTVAPLQGTTLYYRFCTFFL